MDDACVPNQLFYGDVVRGARQQGEPKRRYKDTLKNSLKRLHINPETWEDLTQNSMVWRREVKTGATIYEPNWITVAKAKRETLRPQVLRLLNANDQPLPALPTYIPCANRPRRTPSETLHQQPGNVNSSSQEHPYHLTPAANPVKTQSPSPMITLPRPVLLRSMCDAHQHHPSAHNAVTQMAPLTQVTSVLHGFFPMRLLCCMYDSSPRLQRCSECRGLKVYRLTPRLSPRNLLSCVCLCGVAD
ncbi:hypothetical protein SprV_0902758500 [Sparganum proliferum]